MRLLGTSAADLELAGQALRSGLLVAIPTETVYGLAANVWDTAALARIFEAKNRPVFDPLIVHVADPGDAGQLANLSAPFVQELMRAFWPGPLTLVLPKQSRVPGLATSGLPTVAVRCPAHDVARRIIRLAGVPLAAPSANPFGYLSPTKASHVAAQLGGRIDYIVDGGPCTLGVESTVLDLTASPPLVLRPGGLPVEALRTVVPGVQMFERSTTSPRAPGQLPSHYAPSRPLRLLPAGTLANPGILPPDARPSPAGRHVALCFGAVSASAAGAAGLYAQVLDLSPGRSASEAAARLFDLLHRLDLSDCDAIWAERLPDAGLGRAVNDRLARAAAKSSPDL